MPFSESWATAYVQILITLFLFALGILALSMPAVGDDVRNVFNRRGKGRASSYFVAFLLVIFIAFVWFLQSPFRKAGSDKPSAVSVPVTISPAAAAADGNSTAERFVITVGQPQDNKTASGDEQASFAPLVSAVLITGMAVGLTFVWFRSRVNLDRGHLVRELERELIKNFAEGEDTLYDLIYLGRSGATWKDKELVIQALENVASGALNARAYQGDELENLILGLREITLNSGQPAADDNFNRVVEILKTIRRRLSEKALRLAPLVKSDARPKFCGVRRAAPQYQAPILTLWAKQPGVPKYIDAGLANSFLEDLSVEAARSRPLHIAEMCLEEASLSSKIIFRMGVAALRNRQFHTATMALNKLESLAESKGLKACPETLDLLGLLAHFATSGVAGRMRAVMFLAPNADSFSPSLDDCLAGAYEHHYENSDFEAADAVVELKRFAKNRDWGEWPLLPI